MVFLLIVFYFVFTDKTCSWVPRPSSRVGAGATQYPWERGIELGSISLTVTQTSLWHIRFIQGFCGSWLVSLEAVLSFERSWHLGRFLLKEKKTAVAPTFNKADERISGDNWSALLSPWEGHGTRSPGNYFQPQEGGESDRQLTTQVYLWLTLCSLCTQLLLWWGDQHCGFSECWMLLL